MKLAAFCSVALIDKYKKLPDCLAGLRLQILTLLLGQGLLPADGEPAWRGPPRRSRTALYRRVDPRGDRVLGDQQGAPS